MSLLSKNITYVSNTQSNLFPGNKRSSFKNQFDVDRLKIERKKNEYEVAPKTLIFDNKFSNRTVKTQASTPDIIVFRPVALDSLDVKDAISDGNATTLGFGSFVSEEKVVNFKGNRDYICLNEDNTNDDPFDLFYADGGQDC